MPLKKGRKRALNLKEYAHKKLHVDNQESPLTHEYSESQSFHSASTQSSSISEDMESRETPIYTVESAILFYDRLQAGFKNYLNKIQDRPQPSRYNKINSKKRTTIFSQEKKIASTTAQLRSQGYGDIRGFFSRRRDLGGKIVAISTVTVESDLDLVAVPTDTDQYEPVSMPVPKLETDSSSGVSGHIWASGDSSSSSESVALVIDRDSEGETAVSQSSYDGAELQGKSVMVDKPESKPGIVVPDCDDPAIQASIHKLSAKLKSKHTFEPILWSRLTAMLSMLHFYVHDSGSISWTQASELAAIGAGKKAWYARQLRYWVRVYLATQRLPTISPSNLSKSLIEDEGLATDLKLHLQGVGKYFTAMDIVFYMNQPEIRALYGLVSKGTGNAISERTAQRWLHAMEYRYGKEKKGMYIDGHERADVVLYRQERFIPKWKELERRMILRDREGIIVQHPKLLPGELQLDLITHDESTFYGNDQRRIWWISAKETAEPVRKGEGKSIMVSDFCSPEFGWLTSDNGIESSRIFFKAGKNQDGYFDAEDIQEQVKLAIGIYENRFPGRQALFAFDNAPSHQKRSPDALSARKMPKNPKIWMPKPGIRMQDGWFADGSRQELYFPDGRFKGMKNILLERGLWPGKNPLTGKEFLAACKNFQCPKGATSCCARRILFLQPDFVNQKSALEELVENRGHIAIFYPKYHCELNFIEMVWGAAKYEYRMFSHPKDETEMEQNIRDSLEGVTLQKMRRFANRAARFIDSYERGLSGAQAAWANQKYHSHRTLPPDMIREALSHC